MNETRVKRNVILEKSYKFSLMTISVCRVLKGSREYVLSDQLLRSGTSIGANVEESTAAQSKRDFIHKLSIASKEARETRYWLKLLDKSQIVKYDYHELLREIEEIIKIVTVIIKLSLVRTIMFNFKLLNSKL